MTANCYTRYRCQASRNNVCECQRAALCGFTVIGCFHFKQYIFAADQIALVLCSRNSIVASSCFYAFFQINFCRCRCCDCNICGLLRQGFPLIRIGGIHTLNPNGQVVVNFAGSKIANFNHVRFQCSVHRIRCHFCIGVCAFLHPCYAQGVSACRSRCDFDIIRQRQIVLNIACICTTLKRQAIRQCDHVCHLNCTDPPFTSLGRGVVRICFQGIWNFIVAAQLRQGNRIPTSRLAVIPSNL